MVMTMAACGFCLEAGEVIGMAVSNGQMQVDRAAVTGNANLSDGSRVLTTGEAMRIQLSNGNRATLAPNSAAQVYANRLVLKSGIGVIGSAGYKLQANGVEILGGTPAARAQVRVNGGTLQVAALNGPVKVMSADGMVLAKVRSGTAMEVTPGAGAAGTSTVTGTLRQESGKFMLRDQVSNLDVELRGSELPNRVGQYVQATGRARMSADRESQVIEIAMLTGAEMEKGEQQPADGAKPTTGQKKPTGGSSPGAKSGMSSGAKIGLVAAIGGGAAVGIVLATSGDDKPVSR
jgi:hypothetical protein